MSNGKITIVLENIPDNLLDTAWDASIRTSKSAGVRDMPETPLTLYGVQKGIEQGIIKPLQKSNGL